MVCRWAIIFVVYTLDEVITSLLLLAFLRRRPQPDATTLVVVDTIGSESDTESTALLKG